MSTLWTSAQLGAATGAKVAPNVSVGGVSIDSRSLQPGDLFVALKVERDGHDFVADAIKKGAAAALVSRAVDGIDPAKLIQVADPLHALEALGRARRGQVSARVAAVTGSVGKTSTKEALRHLLGLQGQTHASAASYNNLWGVPLSLARMPSDTRFGVFEIGMNHAGEITPLTAQVRPHVAIVTMVAPVHLEHFNSVADIADAKGEIFSGLETGGTAVINGDLEWTPRLRKHAEEAKAKIVTFGNSAGCDVRLKSLHMNEDYSEIEASFFGETLRYRDRLQQKLGLTDLRSIAPHPDDERALDPDGTLWSRDPDACCNFRKVIPLRRALSGFEAEITGRKRFQTVARADMGPIELNGTRFVVNPLHGWSLADLVAHIEKHELPRHPLVADGFLSIGCMPCTQRVKAGEDYRSGRWAGTSKDECGIHENVEGDGI